MTLQAKYVHTNLIAKDWRALAGFYEQVFGCIPVLPERDFEGEKLEAGTGVPGAHLQGVHLRLPGHGESGPTLEIFSYNKEEDAGVRAVNRPGFGHLAFQVENVPAALGVVLRYGAHSVGDVVTLELPDRRKVTFCYITDPEGNILELQSWS